MSKKFFIKNSKNSKISKNSKTSFFIFLIFFAFLFCTTHFVLGEEISQIESPSANSPEQQLNTENNNLAHENANTQNKKPNSKKGKKRAAATKAKSKEATQNKKPENEGEPVGQNQEPPNQEFPQNRPENEAGNEPPPTEENKQNKPQVSSAQKAVSANSTETAEIPHHNEENAPNKITLPDLSDNSATSEISSENTGKQIISERLIKGIVAWVLIISGLALIVWVILANKNIPKEKAIKVKGKKNLYYKNSLRK